MPTRSKLYWTRAVATASTLFCRLMLLGFRISPTAFCRSFSAMGSPDEASMAPRSARISSLEAQNEPAPDEARPVPVGDRPPHRRLAPSEGACDGRHRHRPLHSAGTNGGSGEVRYDLLRGRRRPTRSQCEHRQPDLALDRLRADQPLVG